MAYKPLRERFLSHVKVTQSCWLWEGSKSHGGYGFIRVNGETMQTHRVSYQLFKGEIPEGLFVLHTCDVPACVNPSHLKLGTHQDNMADMMSKGRQAKGEDIAKKISGENSPSAKLTRAQVEEIRRLVEQEGKTQLEVANRYGLRQSTISNIILRITWK